MAVLVQRLTDENRWPRDQLDKAAEERAALRRLLADAMQALPAPRVDEASHSTPPTLMPRTAPERPLTRRTVPPWYSG
jgi:hypothetical protein